jgi:hypothetical protein
MKRIVIATAILAAFGYIGREDYEQRQMEQQEYCARVVAGVHRDYDHLCPAGSYNSYSGLPGAVACVGDGSCTGG